MHPRNRIVSDDPSQQFVGMVGRHVYFWDSQLESLADHVVAPLNSKSHNLHKPQ